MQLIQVPPVREKFVGQTQFPLDTINEGSGQLQVLLAAKVRFPVQFWHTFVELQVWQLATLQVTQVLENRVVPVGQTHTPRDNWNGPGHPQAVNTRFPIHC